MKLKFYGSWNNNLIQQVYTNYFINLCLKEFHFSHWSRWDSNMTTFIYPVDRTYLDTDSEPCDIIYLAHYYIKNTLSLVVRVESFWKQVDLLESEILCWVLQLVEWVWNSKMVNNGIYWVKFTSRLEVLNCKPTELFGHILFDPIYVYRRLPTYNIW